MWKGCSRVYERRRHAPPVPHSWRVSNVSCQINWLTVCDERYPGVRCQLSLVYHRADFRNRVACRNSSALSTLPCGESVVYKRVCANRSAFRVTLARRSGYYNSTTRHSLIHAVGP
ncbi:unnamed protein product [Arctia plantaginis]|uniref:Uncharacterized protein n=1 Tax=Arctia plantaginis TaxID=874455 RepID=A0A8S0ZV10_ARCPL|nr:unnamed protein product [Arctia plantaginis]